MSKVKGPFTYEAPKPEDIKFIPLNQKKEMNGKELMEFYEVWSLYFGQRSDVRMTSTLASICILFEMHLDTQSFTTRITMSSVFRLLSTAILQRFLSILQMSSLIALLRIKPNSKSSSIPWSQCSPSTPPNPLRSYPLLHQSDNIVLNPFKSTLNTTAVPVSVQT
jgi:hypothetical protein